MPNRLEQTGRGGRCKGLPGFRMARILAEIGQGLLDLAGGLGADRRDPARRPGPRPHLLTHADHLLVLTLEDNETVRCTVSHPLYVVGRGFVPAKEIGLGTSIVTRAGPVRVKEVRYEPGSVPVHNLEVTGVHTYFVGEAGVWTHNFGACAQPLDEGAKRAYRAAARELWAQRHGYRADQLGRQIHHNIPLEWAHIMGRDPNRLSNLYAVPKDIHGKLNGHWNAFRSRYRSREPTRSEIRQFEHYLRRLYGHRYRPL